MGGELFDIIKGGDEKCLVEEGESSDELFAQAISTIEGVVTEKFQSGEHSKTSVLKFLKLTLFGSLGVEFGLADLQSQGRQKALTVLDEI